MEENSRAVTLSIIINADTIEKGAKKMESLSALLEKLSEDETLKGTTKLDISAEIVAY